MPQKIIFSKPFLSFWLFFKMGCFTFGGGWSIIAQMQCEFVERREWLTKEELLDIVSVGRSVPGIMIINISVLFGYRVGGILCAILAAFGMALPSVIVLSILAVFYNSIKDNIYIARAMAGVRAAVIPIIICATVNLRTSALGDKIQYGVASVAFLLCLFTPLNNLIVVLLGAAVGLIVRGGCHDTTA